MKIALASDHRGYKLKKKIIKYLLKKQYIVYDLGPDTEEKTNYPEFGIKLGEFINSNEDSLGIAICGSGIGISIACNKVKGIRCAKVSNVKEAKLSKIDNNANIIALGSSTPFYKVLDIIDAFIKTEYTKIERHQKRIDMITEYENK